MAFLFLTELAWSFDKHRPREKLNRTESAPFCTDPSSLACRVAVQLARGTWDHQSHSKGCSSPVDQWWMGNTHKKNNGKVHSWLLTILCCQKTIDGNIPGTLLVYLICLSVFIEIHTKAERETKSQERLILPLRGRYEKIGTQSVDLENRARCLEWIIKWKT